MSDSDEMVLVVELEEFDTSARRRAKSESLVDKSIKTKGKRLRQLRQLREAKRIKDFLGMRRRAKIAARLAMESGGRMATSAAGRLVGGAVGLPIALLLLAGAVTLRLISGKSFEQMGDIMNKMVLGDSDDAARASMRTREELVGNEYVANYARVYGQAALQPTFDRIFQRRLMEAKGASIVREQYQVNGFFDQLILRLSDAIKEAWKDAGGDSLMMRISTSLSSFDPMATQKGTR